MEYAMAKGETKIAYEMDGRGSTALLFIHGWLGQSSWWKAQWEYFRDRFTVVRMDLPGHGQSDAFKKGWTSRQYAEAIQAVAACISAERIILVGHSMAGAYALEASLSLPKLQAIVVVDTLKNIDQVMTLEQAEQGLFGVYRNDFNSAVENILPQYLFAKTTPPHVKQRLVQEFLKSDGERAILLLEPLFKMDIVRILRESFMHVEIRCQAGFLNERHMVLHQLATRSFCPKGSGIKMLKRVPPVAARVRRHRPPSSSVASRMAESPTPRPLVAVTFSLVVTPSSKRTSATL